MDLDAVVSYRAAMSSLREQASTSTCPALVTVDFCLCGSDVLVSLPHEPKVKVLRLGLCPRSVNVSLEPGASRVMA